MRIRSRIFTLACAATLTGCGTQLHVASVASSNGTYVVVLKDGATPEHVAEEHGLSPTFSYHHALNGFAAPMPDARAEALRHDPRVAYVVPDAEAHAFAMPTGIRRAQGTESPTAHIDYTDPGKTYPLPAQAEVAWNFSVAVIDTGIKLSHPDLRAVSGTNIVKSNASADDDNGHGTHVSGTIGAKDNLDSAGKMLGVVGMAPGIRLVAVKVLNSQGSGTMSGVIAGMDWTVAHRNDDPAHPIRVANMSLGGSYYQPVNDAAKRMTDAGITLCVAAGNSGADAGTTSPASAPSAITVAAIADSDGLPGGLGAATSYGPDDSLASFSNYGAVVDVAAPGVNILSTFGNRTGSGYKTLSGTSMATPHVTGAAAVYLQTHPSALPAEVETAFKSPYSAALGNEATAFAVPASLPSGNVNTLPDWNSLVIPEGGYSGTLFTGPLLWARNL